jgi:uncharacterized membrane protein
VSALLCDAYLRDWLDLGLRWLHVIAAIVWIGTSFYFVALDNHLRAPRDHRDEEEGVGGESWEIHGGGFYRVQKYRVAPETLPEPLHWFKWEAYTTWLSGFALFVVLYYSDADTYLVDRSVADIGTGWAIAISIGLLAVAWIVYDVLCRVLERRQLALAGAVFLFVAASAYGAGELFSARAAYVQVGAMLGTIMVANVFFVIIPGHWEVVRAREAGRDPDPVHNLRGKQRSVHNNYLTLPVLFAMLSPHFAFTYGHAHAWLILLVLMLVGAALRHFFNLRHAGRTVWAIPIGAAVAVVALAVAIRPEETQSAQGAAPVPFARVAAIVEQRCVPCHSERPTYEGFSSPPKGVVLESPEEIASRADAIEAQAVQTQAMPLGNVTGMTQAERDLLGRWVRQGAKVR